METYREMNMGGDREMEYNREVEVHNKEKVEVRVVSEEHIDYLKEKFKDDNRRLRVYHDEVHDRYYIDTFAAFALGFLSYNEACNNYDSGGLLYEISKETFERLKEVFLGKIEIIVLDVKEEENEDTEWIRMTPGIIDNNSQDDIYNNYKKNKDELNNNTNFDLFGEDILNRYKIEKNQLFEGDFDLPIVNDSIDENKELYRMYEETLNKIDTSYGYGNGNNKK